MSDELADEIEAINSIYGADTLRPADGDRADEGPASGAGSVFVLRLPGGASWLRLRFPAAYPGEAPAVLGTQRSSGGVRGAGARDARLFAEALGEVFERGAVCVFDAVEAFAARTRDEDEDEEPPEDGHHAQQPPSPAADPDYAPPEWTASDPVTENKSIFIAHVARAHAAHLVGTERRLRAATTAAGCTTATTTARARRARGCCT